MREPIPLRSALQRHEDVVISEMEPAWEVLVLSGLAHEVHGVDPPAARLRAVGPERYAQVEHLPGADQPGSGDQLVRGDEVDRAALVFRTPPVPVAQPGA